MFESCSLSRGIEKVLQVNKCLSIPKDKQQKCNLTFPFNQPIERINFSSQVLPRRKFAEAIWLEKGVDLTENDQVWLKNVSQNQVGHQKDRVG